mgnify:CR=1 FL=1
MTAITIMTAPCRRGHIGRRYTSTGDCIECVKERQRRPDVRIKDQQAQKRKRNSLNGKSYSLWKASARRAQKRNEAFSLTRQWIKDRLVVGTCAISGLPFDLSATKRSPYSPSIDRIVNNKGYTPENCRVILWALNAAFSNWGEEEFKMIVKHWLVTNGETIGTDCW